MIKSVELFDEMLTLTELKVYIYIYMLTLNLIYRLRVVCTGWLMCGHICFKFYLCGIRRGIDRRHVTVLPLITKGIYYSCIAV